MTAAQTGSVEAFGELVVRYQDQVYGYVVRMLADEAAAQDVTQEAFLRAHSSLASLESASSFRSWLLSIAVNHCRNRLRQRKRRQRHVVSDSDSAVQGVEPQGAHSQPSAFAELQSEELRRTVEDAFQALPDVYREVAVLRFQHEMRVKGIAATLDISVAAAESRLRRARQMLQAELAKVRRR